MNSAAVVFIHGLFSSPAVWNDFRDVLSKDRAVAERYDLLCFDYVSPKFRLSLQRRAPDFDLVADKLRGFLMDPPLQYERLVLVSHSQGGLVVQRFLSRMLSEGRGHELARIRGIVMFACPNNGSDLLLLLRKTLSPVLGNRQLRELRPLSDQVTETQRRVLERIVNSPFVADDRCPIPLTVYAGEEDNIVRPASARSVFPDAFVLPGDHFSIVRARANRRSADALRGRLLQALEAPFPSTQSEPDERALRSESPQGYLSNVTTHDPIAIRIKPNGHPVQVILHGGPVELLRNVDIIVSSENTYFEMSQSFKASTSARLRRAAAETSSGGVVLWDLATDGLQAWMKNNQVLGLRMNPGTVAPTSPGALRHRGVTRIYHAAVVEPRPGTQEYDVNADTIGKAVHNVFAAARAERADPGRKLTSICFPLLGSGRGILGPMVSFKNIWSAIEEELCEDSTWEIHFVSWKPEEVNLIKTALIQMSEE
jgi:pimeloyl-ACP methyl ester carboxylesterase